MDPISYLKDTLPSWWTLISSWRPGCRIAVLSTVWPHHAKRSGYHPIAKGLGVALRVHHMRLVPASVSRRFVNEDLDTPFQIATAMKFTHCDQLLVIDGDFQLKLIENVQRLTTARIFAVFHQIPRALEQRLSEAPSLHIDGAICVAKCQIPLVQSVAPPGKSWFVPHGVDTDFFTPSGQRAARPTVLCVGYHQRDFDTLRKSADIIMEAVPSAVVRLVAPPSLLPPELDLGRIELVAGLSDEQLREEYRRAWVLLLPLLDTTANNSLLEGLACGTPIVVSDTGGVRDYVGTATAALCPAGDAKAHASATIDLLRDSVRRDAAARAARLQAENFAWPKIREQLRRIMTAD